MIQKAAEDNVSNGCKSVGHDKRGRFAVGNKLGRGNPQIIQTHKLRKALLSAVTPEDIREVVAVLIEKAKSGDVLAIRELLDRTVGKSVLPIDITMSEEQVNTRVIFSRPLNGKQLRMVGVEIVGGPKEIDSMK